MSANIRLWIVALTAILQSQTPASAGNGINAIGFGAESVLMAGADTAAARDTSSLNTNPAGLAHISGAAFDLYAAAYNLDLAHSDGLGNDRRSSNNPIVLGAAGYARRIEGTNVTAGIGLFVQGGAGAEYKNLQTPFGTRDEFSAITGIVKVTPGLAWQASESLALGMGISAAYASSQQRLFPNTSVFNAADPARTFFGAELKDAHALRYGLRAGVQYRPAPGLTLGAVFAEKIRLPLSGGHLDVNAAAAGLGRVRYRDANLEGFALPREISLGAAWQSTPSTLFSVKVSRLYWADALRGITLAARNPDNALAPAEIRTTSALNWQDRTVVALGMRHDLGAQWTLLAGYNHSRRPMPDDTLSPLIPCVGETHLTAGVAYQARGGYRLYGGIEYQLPETVRYSNPQSPFGPDTRLRLESVALHVMVAWRW